MGESFNQDLKLVSEQANIVTFQTRGKTIVAQFQEDDSIMLTRQTSADKEARFPTILKRAKAG